MRTSADFRPYQHKAREFILATPRCYLAAKPGAGKTGVALAVISDLLHDTFETTKVLVVGPKRVVPQWESEASGWAFSQGLRFAHYTGTAEERMEALQVNADVLTCSFEFMPELMKAIKLRDWKFGLVVFDEASRLRKGGRKGSVTWKAINTMARKTRSRILLMSGSPRPGTAHELFAPVAILDGGERLGKTLGGFRADYLEPRTQNRATGQVYSWKLRAGMETALYGRISDLYFAVAPDLGIPSVVVDRPVVLPEAVAAACEQLQSTQVVDLNELELELMAGSQGVVAGKLHQMCGGAVFKEDGSVHHLHDAKLDELAEVIEEVDGPLIVAYWYSHELERLQRRFPHAVDITTDKGLADAKAGRVELALLHPGSAAHGIDGLQKRYSAIAWYSIPASFELFDQANRRIVRSGQTGETVTIYRLVATNGIVDQRLVRRLGEKEAEQDQFFQHLENRHG